MNNSSNILTSRSQWRGNLYVQDDTTIDGIFHGEIHSKYDISIGKNAQITGIIHAKNMEISGTIDCYIVASGKVEVHPSAHVTGIIRSDDVVVHEGANVAGLSISHCGS